MAGDEPPSPAFALNAWFEWAQHQFKDQADRLHRLEEHAIEQVNNGFASGFGTVDENQEETAEDDDDPAHSVAASNLLQTRDRGLKGVDDPAHSNADSLRDNRSESSHFGSSHPASPIPAEQASEHGEVQQLEQPHEGSRPQSDGSNGLTHERGNVSNSRPASKPSSRGSEPRLTTENAVEADNENNKDGEQKLDGEQNLDGEQKPDGEQNPDGDQKPQAPETLLLEDPNDLPKDPMGATMSSMQSTVSTGFATDMQTTAPTGFDTGRDARGFVQVTSDTAPDVLRDPVTEAFTRRRDEQVGIPGSAKDPLFPRCSSAGMSSAVNSRRSSKTKTGNKVAPEIVRRMQELEDQVAQLQLLASPYTDFALDQSAVNALGYMPSGSDESQVSRPQSALAPQEGQLEHVSGASQAGPKVSPVGILLQLKKDLAALGQRVEATVDDVVDMRRVLGHLNRSSLSSKHRVSSANPLLQGSPEEASDLVVAGEEENVDMQPTCIVFERDMNIALSALRADLEQKIDEMNDTYRNPVAWGRVALKAANRGSGAWDMHKSRNTLPTEDVATLVALEKRASSASALERRRSSASAALSSTETQGEDFPGTHIANSAQQDLDQQQHPKQQLQQQQQQHQQDQEQYQERKEAQEQQEIRQVQAVSEQENQNETSQQADEAEQKHLSSYTQEEQARAQSVSSQGEESPDSCPAGSPTGRQPRMKSVILKPPGPDQDVNVEATVKELLDRFSKLDEMVGTGEGRRRLEQWRLQGTIEEMKNAVVEMQGVIEELWDFKEEAEQKMKDQAIEIARCSETRQSAGGLDDSETHDDESHESLRQAASQEINVRLSRIAEKVEERLAEISSTDEPGSLERRGSKQIQMGQSPSPDFAASDSRSSTKMQMRAEGNVTDDESQTQVVVETQESVRHHHYHHHYQVQGVPKGHKMRFDANIKKCVSAWKDNIEGCQGLTHTQIVDGMASPVILSVMCEIWKFVSGKAPVEAKLRESPTNSGRLRKARFSPSPTSVSQSPVPQTDVAAGGEPKASLQKAAANLAASAPAPAVEPPEVDERSQKKSMTATRELLLSSVGRAADDRGSRRQTTNTEMQIQFARLRAEVEDELASTKEQQDNQQEDIVQLQMALAVLSDKFPRAADEIHSAQVDQTSTAHVLFSLKKKVETELSPVIGTMRNHQKRLDEDTSRIMEEMEALEKEQKAASARMQGALNRKINEAHDAAKFVGMRLEKLSDEVEDIKDGIVPIKGASEALKASAASIAIQDPSSMEKLSGLQELYSAELLRLREDTKVVQAESKENALQLFKAQTYFNHTLSGIDDRINAAIKRDERIKRSREDDLFEALMERIKRLEKKVPDNRQQLEKGKNQAANTLTSQQGDDGPLRRILLNMEDRMLAMERKLEPLLQGNAPPAGQTLGSGPVVAPSEELEKSVITLRRLHEESSAEVISLRKLFETAVQAKATQGNLEYTSLKEQLVKLQRGVEALRTETADVGVLRKQLQNALVRGNLHPSMLSPISPRSSKHSPGPEGGAMHKASARQLLVSPQEDSMPSLPKEVPAPIAGAAQQKQTHSDAAVPWPAARGGENAANHMPSDAVRKGAATHASPRKKNPTKIGMLATLPNLCRDTAAAQDIADVNADAQTGPIHSRQHDGRSRIGI